jgi:hypothetical protein
VLHVDGLPAVGPFSLHAGMKAFDVAAAAMKRALAEPATACVSV